MGALIFGDGFFGRWTFFKFAMWYTYIVEKPDRLYIGITTDLSNRLRQHNNPKVIHTESFESKSEAAKREKQPMRGRKPVFTTQATGSNLLSLINMRNINIFAKT
jgi:hypothetical protein